MNFGPVAALSDNTPSINLSSTMDVRDEVRKASEWTSNILLGQMMVICLRTKILVGIGTSLASLYNFWCIQHTEQF